MPCLITSFSPYSKCSISATFPGEALKDQYKYGTSPENKPVFPIHIQHFRLMQIRIEAFDDLELKKIQIKRKFFIPKLQFSNHCASIKRRQVKEKPSTNENQCGSVSLKHWNKQQIRKKCQTFYLEDNLSTPHLTSSSQVGGFPPLAATNLYIST